LGVAVALGGEHDQEQVGAAVGFRGEVLVAVRDTEAALLVRDRRPQARATHVAVSSAPVVARRGGEGASGERGINVEENNREPGNADSGFAQQHLSRYRVDCLT